MIRILSNALLLFGHFLLLYFSVKIGIIVKLVGSISLCVYFCKLKQYDMVTTLSAFSFLELVHLFV